MRPRTRARASAGARVITVPFVGHPVAASIGSGGLLVLLALAVFIGYRYSLKIHPGRRCHGCHGSGLHSGDVFQYAVGPCRTCHGAKIFPRWGLRLFAPAEHRKMLDATRK